MLNENKKDFYRLAYSYVKNSHNSLDVIGEATYKGLNSLNKLQDTKFMKTWFYRIIINESIRFLNKNKDLLFNNDFNEKIEINNIDREEIIDIRNAIDKLPGKYKTVIILKYYKQMKIKEIANVLCVNENTVKTRLRRGTNKLKSSLGGLKWKES
jgi:RNA polymerase sigma-70 factor (ECF subfamily)